MLKEVSMGNPFQSSIKKFGGGFTQTVDVEGRIALVKRFDAAQLESALQVPGLQKTVRLAIERRLRKLQSQK